MKNTRSSAKREIRVEVKADSDRPVDNQPTLDPFDTTLLGGGIPNFVLDPKSVPQNYPPLASDQEIAAMNQFYEEHPKLHKETVEDLREHNKRAVEPPPEKKDRTVFYDGLGFGQGYDRGAAWIQTHSGRRFTPTNPHVDAIVIQDISHALSMQCRFSGHCKKFYSVAQHSVLVSYICDSQDALWGLMHDASEAYLVDVPRPLKRSGKFQAYIDFEEKMQEAICRRFGLPLQEPPSVKRADTLLLATEARDLMSPLHHDWEQPVEPLPFAIDPWDHDKAKDMFMKRFFELTTGDSAKHHYEHYLKYRDQL
jgi:uncharacterized protein